MSCPRSPLATRHRSPKSSASNQAFTIYAIDAPAATYHRDGTPLPDRVTLLQSDNAGRHSMHILTPCGPRGRFWIAPALSFAADGMIRRRGPKSAGPNRHRGGTAPSRAAVALLPMDLVDVKVCAVDETWSGLAFVIRKAPSLGHHRWRGACPTCSGAQASGSVAVEATPHAAQHPHTLIERRHLGRSAGARLRHSSERTAANPDRGAFEIAEC